MSQISREGLDVEGLAGPLGDAVVIDGQVRHRRIPLGATLPGVEIVAGEAALPIYHKMSIPILQCGVFVILIF
jgi:hypothetical protein